MGQKEKRPMDYTLERGEALASEVLAKEIKRLTQERDAQFAHNSTLLERIEELQADNDFHNEYLVAIQKELGEPHPPEGHIVFNIVERVRALRANAGDNRQPADDAGRGVGDTSDGAAP